MSSKLTTILDALPNDDYTVGGEGWNQLVKILTNTNVESEEDLTINTKIKWQSGKLVLLDAGAPFSHEIIIEVENIVTGDPRHLTVRAFANTTDYIVTEQEAAVLLAKTFGSGVAGTEAKFGRAPDFQGFGLDNVGTIKIHDTGSRNVATIEVSNTTPNTYFEFLSGYNTANHAALSTANDIKVRFGFGSEIDEYSWYSQADGSNSKIFSVSETLFDIPATTVDFHDSTINNILLAKAQIPATVVHTDQNNTYGDFTQFFRNTRMVIRNPSNTFSLILDVPTILADRTVSFPLIEANDTFALKGINNLFTAPQKITNATGQLMTFYRPENTAGFGAGFYFNFNDSLDSEQTYGFEYVSIENNVLATLRGDYNIQLAINNVLGLRFRVFTSGDGGIIFGNNQRGLLSETGLTTQRIFTLPDLTGQLVIQEFANVFSTLQKIQYNTAANSLTLFRGSAAAVGSLAGVYFTALNNAAAEINYANIVAGSGPNTADIVSGTEKGQILLQILDGGSLVTKLQITNNTLQTTGIVPKFTVGSADLDSIFITRPINVSAGNMINFNMQNVSSIDKVFGKVGIRSTNVSVGTEEGVFQVYLMKAGIASQIQLEVVNNEFRLGDTNKLIFNNSGLTADRTFTFPNGSGKLLTEALSQVLTNKTLSSGTVLIGDLSVTNTLGLHVIKNVGAGVAEVLARFEVADNSTSYIQFDNAVTNDNLFYPRMVSFNTHVSSGAYGFQHLSNIDAAADNVDNVNAVTIFDVRRSNNTAIQFKRLFQFRNASTSVFEIYTDRFDFSSKRLTNAVLNVNTDVTIKHSTTNTEGDILSYKTATSRYDRVPAGSNNQFLGVAGGVVGYYTPVGVSGVLALAGLTDDVQITSLANNDILVYESVSSKWKNIQPTASGEVNTISNVGSSGVGLFKQKTLYNLELYKIDSADNKLAVALSGTDFLQLTINEANLNIANMTGSIGDARITDLTYGKLTGVPSAFAPSNHGSTHLSNGTDAIPIATTLLRGTVELATDGEGVANVVVQGSDSRLSNARAPTAHVGTHTLGGSDALTILYMSNASYVIYQTATHYVVRNNYTGALQTFVNTDFAPALEWVINNMVNAGAGGVQSSLYGGIIFIMRGKYTATTSIDPSITTATRHGMIIAGEGWGTEINLAGTVGTPLTDGILIDMAAFSMRDIRVTANEYVTNLIHVIGHGAGQRRNDHFFLENIQTEGPNGNAGWATLPHIANQVGLLLDGTTIASYYSTIRNCKFHSFEKGIHFKGAHATSCFCIHNSFKWCETGIEISDSSGQLQIDGAWIQGDTFSGTTGIDIKSTAGGYIYIDHVTSELHRENPALTPVACQTVLIGTGIGNCFIGKHISNAFDDGIITQYKTIVNNSTQVNHTPLNWGWKNKNFITLIPDNDLIVLESGRRFQVKSGTFYLDDNAGHNWILTKAAGTLGASRTVALPLLTANDQVTCDNHATTLTKKTISGLKTTVNAKTANYTALETDDYIPCTPAANMTITLPTVAIAGAGKILTIQKIDSSAFTVTIDGASSEQVNGQLTMVLTAQYQVVKLYCDGTAWFASPYSNVRRGITTASGNGSTTTFNVPHGLGVIPHDALIQCSSHTIAFTYTTTSTNIVVVFVSAPGSGTNNVIFHWSAVP